jgi:hypothetical protein
LQRYLLAGGVPLDGADAGAADVLEGSPGVVDGVVDGMAEPVGAPGSTGTVVGEFAGAGWFCSCSRMLPEEAAALCEPT